MKPKLLHLLILAALISLSVTAFLFANGTTTSFETFRSPLTDNPPAPGETLGQPAARRVVLVIIDGLRLDTSLDTNLMPTLAKLRAAGASAPSRSRAPSYSLPGYATLLTGAWPDLHSGPAFNTAFEQIPALTQDTVFAALHDQGIPTAIAAYYWFGALLPPDVVDRGFFDPGDDRAADERVMAAALPWLNDPENRFILIHIDQVDYAGHNKGGPRDERWEQAAQRADTYLAEIRSRLDLKQDVLIVTSDHGHILAGGHGGYDQDTLVEPLVLAGKGVLPGDYAEVEMVDIPTTIAALFGARLPASSQGRVLVEMVSLNETTAANLVSSQLTQQTALLRAYARAIGQPVDETRLADFQTNADFQAEIKRLQSHRLNRERLVRALPVLLLLVGVIWLPVRLLGRSIWTFLAAAGAYWAVFLFRHGIADQRAFSFSSISSSETFIFYIITTAGAAFGLAWIFLFLKDKVHQKSPGQAFQFTLKLAGLIMLSLTIVCLVYAWLYGPTPSWMLPDLRFSYWNLLALMQIVFLLPIGLLFGGIGAALAYFSPKNT